MVGRGTLTPAMLVRIQTPEPSIIQESSNGRTAGSEPAYLGSNPSS
jgi:hypothetical protein